MSAEILREAAALMRERAEAAKLWALDDGGVVKMEWHAAGELVDQFADESHAEHIASWHPAVALAVADWLETVASGWEGNAERYRPGGAFEALGAWSRPDHHPALAVARAYLGRTS